MMKKIQIAHECPIDIIRTVNQFTDYDYAVSTMTENEGYWSYFEEAKSRGRKLLLDNGLYEDGIAQNEEDFVKKILEVKPDEYIVPDVWEDGMATIQKYDDWLKKYKDLPGVKIGVVQGKTVNEWLLCYHYMRRFADKVAINHGNSVYIDYYENHLLGPSVILDAGKLSLGRYIMLKESTYPDLPYKPHHLLGVAHPSDLANYYDPRSFKKDSILSMVESMDTSAPVIAGVEGMATSEDFYRLFDPEYEKIKTKVKDIIDSPLNEQQINDIINNVKVVHGIRNAN